LQLTILYNPDSRGAIGDGAILPIRGSMCGTAFSTGTTQHYHRIEDVRDLDPEFYQCTVAEGLRSGCDIPLKGRNGVVGVLAALKRSERGFERDDVAFLEQAARQVAIAVENALDYEQALRDRDKETKQRQYLEEEMRAEFGSIVGESRSLKSALNLVRSATSPSSCRPSCCACSRNRSSSDSAATARTRSTSASSRQRIGTSPRWSGH
jgi:formate hydrogenlyase transcriptional activator